MIIKRTISKEEIKELPKAVFEGPIHVIQSEKEADKAVAYLQAQSVLGIDSETVRLSLKDNLIKLHYYKYPPTNAVSYSA